MRNAVVSTLEIRDPIKNAYTQTVEFEAGETQREREKKKERLGEKAKSPHGNVQ